MQVLKEGAIRIRACRPYVEPLRPQVPRDRLADPFLRRISSWSPAGTPMSRTHGTCTSALDPSPAMPPPRGAYGLWPPMSTAEFAFFRLSSCTSPCRLARAEGRREGCVAFDQLGPVSSCSDSEELPARPIRMPAFPRMRPDIDEIAILGGGRSRAAGVIPSDAVQTKPSARVSLLSGRWCMP